MAFMRASNAIYSRGDDTYVFVRGGDPDGAPQPRKVKLGITTDSQVQIEHGVTEGEHVLLLEAGQGADLLTRDDVSS